MTDDAVKAQRIDQAAVDEQMHRVGSNYSDITRSPRGPKARSEFYGARAVPQYATRALPTLRPHSTEITACAVAYPHVYRRAPRPPGGCSRLSRLHSCWA